MKSTEELAMVREFVLNDYKRLVCCHCAQCDMIRNDCLNCRISGERSAFARVIGLMGMEVPIMDKN